MFSADSVVPRGFQPVRGDPPGREALQEVQIDHHHNCGGYGGTHRSGTWSAAIDTGVSPSSSVWRTRESSIAVEWRCAVRTNIASVCTRVLVCASQDAIEKSG